MEIQRQKYLDKLIDMQYTDNIKVITGIRRCGKSVILKQLYTHFSQGNSCLYINLEDFANYHLHDTEKFNSYIESNINEGVSHIFIDEVQLVPNFQLVLNSLRLKCGNIYVTGSNANILSGKLATMLSGRYISIRIYPFTYQESLEMKPDLTIDSYLLHGGMPSFAFLPKEVSKMVLRDLIDTIAINDILNYNSNIDVELLKRILLYLFDNLSTEISAQNISNYLSSNNLKTNINKVYEILNALSDAYLVSKANNYNLRGKEVLKNKGKYYLADVGFRTSLYPEIRDIGRVIENVIYNELQTRGYEIYVGKIDKHEVDFVLKRANEIIYVQVSVTIEESQETLNREVGVFSKINDNFKKILITNDDYKASLGNGIIHVLLKDLLNGEEL